MNIETTKTFTKYTDGVWAVKMTGHIDTIEPTYLRIIDGGTETVDISKHDGTATTVELVSVLECSPDDGTGRVEVTFGVPSTRHPKLHAYRSDTGWSPHYLRLGFKPRPKGWRL